MLESVQKYFIGNKKILLISLAILLLAFTPLKLLSLIACVVLWALYWPLGKLVNSMILRLALAFVLISCFQQFSAMVFWIAKLPLTLPVVVLLELLVVAVLIALKQKPAKITFITWADAVALLAGVGTVLILMFQLFNSGGLLPNLIRQVTTGYDNIQHISLTQTLYNEHGYVLDEVDNVIDKVIYFNLASYPQGWSLTSSIWWHGFSDNLDIQKQPTTVLALYVGAMMAWYILLVYLFCRLILLVSSLISGRKNDLVSYVGALAFVGLCELLFLIAMPYNGFASFFPALVVPLALVFVITSFLVDNRPSQLIAALPAFMVTGVLLAGGMSFSWLLAAPVGFLMVLATLLTAFNSDVVALLKWLISKPVLVVGLVALVGIAAMQGVVQLKFGVPGLVNWAGGSGNLNYFLVTLFLLSACVVLAFAKNKIMTRVFAASLAGALLMPGLVYLYQYATNGQANYFSIKITYITITLLAVFAGAALLELAHRYSDKGGDKLVGALFVVGLVVFLPMSSNLELGSSPILGIGTPQYIAGNRFMSEKTANQVAELLEEKKIFDTNLVVFKHTGYAEDITGTHFIDMLSRKRMNYCEGETLGDLTSGWKIRPENLRPCIKDKENFYILASGQNIAELKKEYSDLDNVHIMLSD